MCVYWGDNHHDFGDKNLLYALFIWSNSVQVSDGYNFLAASTELVPDKFPGYHAFHPLDPA